MFRVQVHKRINQMMELFYRLGLWHRGDEATGVETGIKLFYSIFHSLYTMSIMAGAITTDNSDESIFLVLCAILMGVMSFKLSCIIWRKKQILELLHRICIYSIVDQEDFTLVDDQVKSFMKFGTFFISFSYFAAICAVLVVPFLGSEKTLFVNLGLPLDWKNNELHYWIAFTFATFGMFLSSITLLFSLIIWYLMVHCALKYNVLGNYIRKMGVIGTVGAKGNQRRMPEEVKQNLFQQDLITVINSHQDIKKY